MTPTPECRWCETALVRHEVGNHVTVWVHAATNSIWCFWTGGLAARPLGRWRR